MRKLRAKQEGLTLGGLIFTLSFIAIVVLFAVRAFPLYNEKLQIVSAVNSVVSQPDSAKASDADLRKKFLSNMYATTNIRRFDESNVKKFVLIEKPKSAGDPKVFHLKYEARNKLVADLELVLKVDQKFPVRGNEGGE
jgi:hypothetical protein